MEEKKDIINFHERIIQQFTNRRRPPVEIRYQVDIDYTFKDSIIEIFELRPMWDDLERKIVIPIAKSKFTKSR